MRLWTVWVDYGATGEGATLIVARIAYAEDERSALEDFKKQSGDFYAACAFASQGVLENNITKLLFAREALEHVRFLEGRANVDLFARFHFNAS